MKKTNVKSLTDKDLVNAIVTSLNEAKAEKIVVINLKKYRGATDWFIISESDNDAHIRACAHRVLEDLSEKHTIPWQREGMEEGRWVLLDYSDVVVHIMLSELRVFYNLEDLWAEGTCKKIDKNWNPSEL